MLLVHTCLSNTKTVGAICFPRMIQPRLSVLERVEALFFAVFGGVLWTWITIGLQKEEMRKKRSK